MGIIDKLVELEIEKTKPLAEPVKQSAKEYIRTLGDVRVAAEAQRSFNPQLPPVKPRGPAAAQLEKGTSAALHAEPGWGGTDA